MSWLSKYVLYAIRESRPFCSENLFSKNKHLITTILCTFRTSSHEDFALASKLRPANFSLHRLSYSFSPEIRVNFGRPSLGLFFNWEVVRLIFWIKRFVTFLSTGEDEGSRGGRGSGNLGSDIQDFQQLGPNLPSFQPGSLPPSPPPNSGEGRLEGIPSHPARHHRATDGHPGETYHQPWQILRCSYSSRYKVIGKQNNRKWLFLCVCGVWLH